MAEPRLRVLSLGAGVQSTTLALMAAAGEMPMPDCAIFADTQWEPAAVYEHLAKLEAALPFPVYKVTAGSLRDATMAGINSGGRRFAAIPWFTLSPRGKPGMGRRQCTKEYKLRPIQRKVVELLGGRRPAGGCEMLIGISTDEASRARTSRVRYVVNRYPLLDASMSRRQCEAKLKSFGWHAPRSACVACPFHSDEEWSALTAIEFEDAIATDLAIRHQPRFRSEQFVHRARVPLSEVDFRTDEERGQLRLFNDECEGMCGV